MYNRYIPGTNGHYQCNPVEQPCLKPPEQKPEPAPPPPKQTLPSGSGPDLGDLLLLCVVLLLLLDSEDEDLSTLLITAAAFLFLQ